MVGKKNSNQTLDYQKKNRRKRVRTVLQLLFLLAIFGLLIDVAIHNERYIEPDKSTWTNRDGFVALSYFGVSRSGTPTLISRQQLDKHFDALKEQGYETISQEDILNFYYNKGTLPDKAIYLAFEDGRNDSSIFTQPLLEKYNYKATVMTYANKFNKREFKFLQPKDLLEMRESGFWELGSNGYRLTYINILDRFDQYLGVLDEEDFQDVQAKSYTHYLMDFIRDENAIPIENRSEMEARIDEDYRLMHDIYMEALGFVPRVYTIMHANALYNGMNQLVDDANDANIRENFQLHFNREGFAFNHKARDVYDLTRVQPAPHWSVNHLLMKLQEDTKQKMNFFQGDADLAAEWELVNGVAEFTGNKIILTSPWNAVGILYLKNSDTFDRDLTFRVTTDSVPEGKQSVYLRYDKQADTYVRIVVESHQVSVVQKLAGEEEQVLSTAETAPTKQKQLEIKIDDNLVTVSNDRQVILENIAVDAALASGGVALSAAPKVTIEEDQVLDDIYYKGQTIYDSVYYDIEIEASGENSGKDPERLFANSYNGFEKQVHQVKTLVDRVIDWTIATF
ncbi:polysaccharide deacetylase family protein [Radiobacillus sp. PE A8.2]|uniref:polysaccharide deacetylase family protein n=1 Tax=Radiobacillus sp. PE A8.2 TaxID=3380349 RepID=UPI00388F4A21